MTLKLSTSQQTVCHTIEEGEVFACWQSRVGGGLRPASRRSAIALRTYRPASDSPHPLRLTRRCPPRRFVSRGLWRA